MQSDDDDVRQDRVLTRWASRSLSPSLPEATSIDRINRLGMRLDGPPIPAIVLLHRRRLGACRRERIRMREWLESLVILCGASQCVPENTSQIAGFYFKARDE